MLKNRFVNILLVLSLVLVLALSVAGAASAAKPEQATLLPTLKLGVTQSPLTIYPPIMIYTAQLSFVPPTPTTQLRVDFYNISSTGTAVVYLGSAPVDSTGKAVLNKQMTAGTYTAIAKILIGTQTVLSNKVLYKVP